MNRRYSRLVIPHKAGDGALVALLWRHAPLGFDESGRDLVAFFREAAPARDAGDALRRRRVPFRLTTDIPERDPLEAYRAASRPFPVGRRFWLEPGEDGGGRTPEGRIALRVPASRAFGTGSHASTRLALEALEDEPLSGRSMLDVGTGSGVLALAAAALGARAVAAFDVDSEAVFVARENVRGHAFGGAVRVFAGTVAACAGRFDLVVANMLADEILADARGIRLRVARRGRMLLSGITRDREADVLARCRSGRWKLAGRRTEDEWISLTLERAS